MQQNHPLHPICLLVGPTAVGKSSMAMHLALRFNGEIINADSLQLCKGLDVGTAKPTLAERQQVPHHLYDQIEPGEQLSAADYALLAKQVINSVQRRGCLPILVGGSGFYIRALFQGLAPLPPVGEKIRNDINKLMDEKGLPFLYEQLKTLDPQTAARLHANDSMRIRRALEVQAATGRPLSEHLRLHQASLRPSSTQPPLILGLSMARAVLYERINQRTAAMFRAVPGILNEVKQFAVGKERGIGYEEAAAVQAGRLSLEEAIARTAQRTRHYAKRQMTWFRGDADINWFDAADQELQHKIEQTVYDYINESGNFANQQKQVIG